jgi:cation:H+ antiporter
VLGLSPLLIGLTVVAYGTSAPELAVSVQATSSGQNGMALGNVIGSNILNVLLVLGVSALITPLRVAQRLVRIDVPVLIAVSIAVLLLAGDGNIGRADGGLLAFGMLAYTLFAIRMSRREERAVREEYAAEFASRGRETRASALVNVALVLGGLVALVAGARWLVAGAVMLAQAWGLSDLIIGLTIVAGGTSLPEVATSIVAALRGERDIAVGNVVGSNMFNLLAVLGLSALVSPEGITVSPAARSFDLPVMVAVAVACLPIFFTDYTVARWEGALFLAYYAAYAAYLVLAAVQHDALSAFSGVMTAFVLPLTALTLIVITVRAARRRVA